MKDKNKSFLVQTLVKGIDILECFNNDTDEKGIKEISQIIDMPESSVHRIINTLEHKGLIVQNTDNKKYRLGIKLLIYRNKTENMYKWKEKAKFWMGQLNDKCGENVNLAIRDDEHVVYIEKVDSKHLLRPDFEMGKRYPSYCTSLGKVLLSDIPKQTLEVLFDNFSNEVQENTIYACPDLETLKNELKEIKNQGYAIDDEEFQIGLKCVAAPIKAFGGKVVAAISVTTPTARLDEEKFSNIKDLVIETAKKISKEISKIL